MDQDQTPDEHATAADGIWQPIENSTESVSLSEHEATFSREARENAEPEADEAAPEGETAEQKEARLHHSSEQKRERETGKFTEGKKRHRAASQQAGAEDVPRIQALTAKLRTAEAEVQRLKEQHASPATIARAEAKVDAAADRAVASGWNETAPSEDDEQFGGDYGKYLEARAEWAGRKGYHEAKQREAQEETHARRTQAQHARLESFGQRVASAKDRYEDFEAVAFGPTRIVDGSIVDAFIMEDEHGADLLYHLNKHPDDLADVQGASELKQLKMLSLLSQRFDTDSTREAAGTTGAAPAPKLIVLPPKPPTPVRTEAQRAHDGPPSDRELSLSEHEKYFGRRTAR